MTRSTSFPGRFVSYGARETVETVSLELSSEDLVFFKFTPRLPPKKIQLSGSCPTCFSTVCCGLNFGQRQHITMRYVIESCCKYMEVVGTANTLWASPSPNLSHAEVTPSQAARTTIFPELEVTRPYPLTNCVASYTVHASPDVERPSE